MKGGGLTWAGWLMIGMGGLLIYAGMTGQSLVAELAAVINGKKLPKPDNLPDGRSSSTGAAPNALEAKPPAAPHPSTIPYPTYGPQP